MVSNPRTRLVGFRDPNDSNNTQDASSTLPPKKKGDGARFTTEGRNAPTSSIAAPCGPAPPPFLVTRRRQLEDSVGATLPDFDVLTHAGSSEDSILACQPFVGLNNLGATCYMNSLLQTIFTSPEMRQHIIQFPFDVKQRHNKNVAYQLQLLFSRMQQMGLRRSCDTRDLVSSFGMGMDAHREQHDVQELNRVLMDVLQEFIDRHEQLRQTLLQQEEEGREEGGAAAAAAADTPTPTPTTTTLVGQSTTEVSQIIQQLYKGLMLDVLKCLNCGHSRITQSSFLDIVLPLCSMMGEAYDEQAGICISKVEDCLDRFVAKETIDGVECSHCSGRHTVEKFQQFDRGALPRILSVQLLRMQYNIETGRRDKVHKDIKLPVLLDLEEWSAWHRESTAAAMGDGEGVKAVEDTAEAEDRTAVTTGYRLHAIICHRGTAYHGHYYTYVACYPQSSSDDNQHPKWLKFDDDTVSWVDDGDILEYLDPAAWKQQDDVVKDMPSQADASSQPSQAQQGPLDAAAAPAPLDIDAAFPLVDRDAPLLLEALFEGAAACDAGEAPKSSFRNTKRYISGHSYYAFYRRADIPPFTGHEVFSMQPYVESLLEPELSKLKADRDDLCAMAFKLTVDVAIGDVDRALTEAYRWQHPHAVTRHASVLPKEHVDGDSKSASQEGAHPVVLSTNTDLALPSKPYKLAHAWIDVDWRWNVGQFMSAIEEYISTHCDTLAKEMNISSETLDACLASILSQCPWRLRAFNKSLNAMGEAYDDREQPLSRILSPKRSATHHFALQVIPADDTLRSIVCVSNVQSGGKCDNPVTVCIQSTLTPTDFPIHNRHVISIPHGTSVESFKTWMRMISGIPEDDQVVTAVVNGECVIRTTGILVGEPVYIEQKEPGRRVASRRKAYADDDEDDEDSRLPVFPSRAQEYVHESYCVDVEYVAIPADMEDATALALIGSPEHSMFPVLRIDRRSSLKVLKRALIEKFTSERTAPALPTPPKDVQEDRDTSLENKKECFNPPLCEDIPTAAAASSPNRQTTDKAFQLWVDAKAAIEPKNMDSSIYIMSLGATCWRVALVERPVLEEGFRPATVSVMRRPISYDKPTIELARVHVGPETTLLDVLRDANFTDYSGGLIRGRILPPGRTIGFGNPMTHPVILDNVNPSTYSTSEPLRIVIQRIHEPEALEKGSLIVHAHHWHSNLADPEIDLALGVEHEIVINKSIPAFALRDQLSELFNIPVDALQVAPARFFQLQSHDSVYTSLEWDAFSNPSLLQKAVAAHPLALEMDQILLIRSKEEPWVYVSADALASGHATQLSGPSRSTSGNNSLNKLRSALATTVADKGSQDEKGGTADIKPPNSKKARSEAGITIRAVWECESEPEEQQPPQAPSVVSQQDDEDGAFPNPPLLLEDIPSSQAAPSTTQMVPLNHVKYYSAIHKLTQEVCMICFSDFVDGEEVTILKCHHIFHRICLAPWLDVQRTCPTCNEVL